MHASKVGGAAAVGALLVSVTAVTGMTGLAGVASADPATDASTLAANVPTAVEVLVAGLEEAVDVLTGTHQAVETAAALGEAVVDAGSTLVADTDQFAPLALGVLVVNDGVQELLAPVLGAVDDPSTAPDVVDPTDVSTLAANVPAAVEGVLHGDALAGGAIDAVVEALQGNLIHGRDIDAVGTPAFVGNLFNGTGFGLTTLVAGTSLEPLVLPLAVLVLMGAMAGADHLLELEEALAPAFDALGPVTEPLVGELERR